MPPLSFALVWKIVSSKWGKRVALVLAVLLALWLFGEMRYKSGHESGKKETTQTVANTQAKDLGTKYDNTTDEVAQLRAHIEQLRNDQAEQQKMFLALALQRQAVPQQVASLTPAQLQSAVEKALGSTSALDRPLTVEEKRRVLECFEEKSICDKQLTNKQTEVDQKAAEIKDWETSYSTLAIFANEAYTDYVDLYNLTAQGKRKWWCVWMCKRAPQLTVPDPRKLKKPELKKPKGG